MPENRKGCRCYGIRILDKHYPNEKGFSPRSLRRMRDFYRTYENCPALLWHAMELGWIQNVVIMEAELTIELREWYLKAAKQFGWSKTELIANIVANAHENIVLTTENEECYIEDQEEKRAVPRMEVLLTIKRVIHQAIWKVRKRRLIWKEGGDEGKLCYVRYLQKSRLLSQTQMVRCNYSLSGFTRHYNTCITIKRS